MARTQMSIRSWSSIPIPVSEALGRGAAHARSPSLPCGVPLGYRPLLRVLSPQRFPTSPQGGWENSVRRRPSPIVFGIHLGPCRIQTVLGLVVHGLCDGAAIAAKLV